MNETWKIINNFDSYEISNYGNVRSVDRYINMTNEKNPRFYKGKKLSKKTDKDGYKIVVLCKNGKKYYKKIHRLVAEAFIEKIIGKDQVNHLDENKANNMVNNLEWVTSKENTLYGTLQTRMKKNMPKKPIIATSLEDGSEIEFESGAEARRNGFPNAHGVLSGRVKSSNGYTFRYK